MPSYPHFPLLFGDEPILPHITSQPREVQRANKTQFGDGYYQVSRHGINSVFRNWDVVYFKKNKPNAELIIDFFNNNFGKPFGWDDPFDNVTYNYTCTQWEVEYHKNELFTIRAFFERFF